MMKPASLPHDKLMKATKLIGRRVAPVLHEMDENVKVSLNKNKLAEMN
jgi:hypothetical protein